MRRKLDKPSVGESVVALAVRQHGVVARAQLVARGLDDGAIGRWVRAKRLHRVHRGVYALGYPKLTRDARFMAAVLACGDGAALSHFAAAVLWGLISGRGPRIDVTVPSRGGRAPRRVVIVHRAALPPADAAVKDAIAVTTPARTLVDLADVVSRRQLERAIDEAHYLRLDLTALRPLPGRRGSGLLSRVLESHGPGSTGTESRLAERMLELCDGAALPRPAIEATIEGHRVDFAWPDRHVIVETDGWRAHGTRSAFERDRRRDLALAAAGWHVVRITWRQLQDDADWVAHRLRRLLGT